MVLRKALPLDNLLAVAHEFLNLNVSRWGFDRCLRRHDVDNLRSSKARAEWSRAQGH